MNTSLRPITCTWMLCGLIATGAGPGCNGGEKPPQPGIAPASTWIPDSPNDMANSATQDMAIPGPTCQAAMGLAADIRLLCVDFTTSLPASGWTFPVNCGADTWKWTIVDDALTLSNFGNFGLPMVDTECSFMLPLIDARSYQTLTLSILQGVHLKSKTKDETVNQRAQILLEGQTQSLVQFTGGGGAQIGTGMTVPSFRRSTIQVQGGSGGMKFTFKLSTFGSAGGTGEWGWFIKSIAVLGHK
ncbi:MAG: hypothetical protein JNJ46_02210 [Myxococcales bacterium]|nr:hypothetical protein [Myxococcales bacterium]